MSETTPPPVDLFDKPESLDPNTQVDYFSEHPELSEDYRVASHKGLWLNTSDLITVRAYLYFLVSGRLGHILPNPVLPQFTKELGLTEEVVEAKFRIPSRKEMDRYRNKSGRFVAKAGVIVQNKTIMRDFLIRYHLESLNLPDPEDAAKELIFPMTDETYRKLGLLHPGILELLVNKFVIDGNLILS